MPDVIAWPGRCPDCGLPLPTTQSERFAHADRHVTLNLQRKAVAVMLAAGWSDLAEEGARRLRGVQERRSA